MTGPSRHDHYVAFIDFVRSETGKRRQANNRRMFHVLFWCFIMPVIASVALAILIRVGVLPLYSTRGYLETVALAFPILYALYVLASEVARPLPGVMRKGGMNNTLQAALDQEQWRTRTCDSLARIADRGHAHWEWIEANFRMDLDLMRDRNKYLTALAGAVLFLIINGIGFISDPLAGDTPLGDFSQLLSLGLFLVLLYLSGSETHQALLRYLHCVELMRSSSK